MLSWCCGMVESLVIGAYLLKWAEVQTNPPNRYQP
jgi:hypothetical protein